MQIEKDPKIQDMFIRKNLSGSRKRMYIREFKRMYEITGLTPTELIKEAKKEEQPFVEEGQAKLLDISERKIKSYILQYYDKINNGIRKQETIETLLGIIRSFYNEYDVALPKKIKITIPRRIIRDGDIPDINDVKTGLEEIKDITYKAVILFIVSSGMRAGDVINLTIEDFLIATKDYHDNSLEELLESEKEIIPTWVFVPRKTQKDGNICITFNSHEASRYIIKTIKKRIKSGEKIKNDSPLFVSSLGKKYSEKGFYHICLSVNNRTFERGKSKDGKAFFRAHNLRKLFLSAFSEKTKDLFALKVVAGHSFSENNNENYLKVVEKETKRSYLKVLPFLCVEDTEVNIIDDDATKKLKAEIESKDKEIEEIKKQQEMILEMLKERDIK